MKTKYGERPWWWYLNPWRALRNRECMYKEATDIIKEQALEIWNLHVARAEKLKRARSVKP